jgi:L-asparaginase II
VCDVDLGGVEPAVESCGLPTYPLPLVKLAHGMARFGTGRGLADDERAAAQRIAGAIRAHPDYLVGAGRTSTVICQATEGRVVVKGGAEGVYAGFIASAGLGFALKVDDGASRGADVAVIGLLSGTGLLSADECRKLGPRVRPPVADHFGKPVGEVVWVG